MRRSNSELLPITVLERCAIVVLGLYLAAVGLHAVATGRLLYENYLRSPVAAPVAIVIGLVLIGAGFFAHH